MMVTKILLDTNFRKYIQPFIQYTANFFIKINMSANQVTALSLILGIGSGILIYTEHNFTCFIILWISGLLDAVDGTIARVKGSTPFGTVMDVTFDRIVEIALIIAFSYRYPESLHALVFLCSSIIISMTIFLTTGIMYNKSSMKSFYYQTGLMERTEGFLMFSLMILFPNFLTPITVLFTTLILYTALQRYLEAKKLLDHE